MTEKISLNEKVNRIFDQLPEEKTKNKKLKIPRKAKVSRSKIKKGWIGILKVDENNHISGEKQKISGSSLRLRDGTYHASDGREVLFWEGKFPVILQPTWKKNPIQIRPNKETNETYGQSYIMAKMLADSIRKKTKSGNIIIWIVLIIAVLVGINYFMGGGTV